MSVEHAVTWNSIAEVEARPRRQTAVFKVSWTSKKERSNEIEILAKRLLVDGAEYLRNTIGDEYDFPNQFDVRLCDRTKHGATGNEIALSVEHLSRGISNSAARELQQSLIIHELAHHFEPEREGLSMMIEIAFMLEHGRMDRIHEIETLIAEGKFPRVYLEGMEEVAEALGHLSIEQFLQQVTINDYVQLKTVFAEKMRHEIARTKTQPE